MNGDDARTESDARLKAAAKKIGDLNGYRATGEFAEYDDLTVRWLRRREDIVIRVCDYLDTAPDEVLETTVGYVFDRIDRRRTRRWRMYEWLRSDEFLREKRPVFMRRHRFKGPEGRCKDLRTAADSLKEMGLVPEDTPVEFTWTSEQILTEFGFCSTVFKVVVISDALDSDDVPDEVLEWVVYHHYCLAALEFGMDDEDTERLMNDRRRMLPGWSRRRDWLIEWSSCTDEDDGGDEGEDDEGERDRSRCPPAANTPFHGPPMTAVSRH